MNDATIFGYLFSVWGMIIVAIVCSMLGGVAAAATKNWRKAREAEIEGALKVELVKQGRSADEIERILNATAGSHSGNKE
ncbi:MAG: hypothetical protein HY040_19415 [Planctomycetes bacterium]|nr:hypothetical protein [Planctomycetota bacterium]